MNRFHWKPASLFTNVASDHKPFCLILLNQPINRPDVFRRLWENAAFKLVADGGSNRLYDAFQHDSDSLETFMPDEIRGDLDSIRSEVRTFYQSRNVKVERVEDQDSTDFMKCVAWLKEKEKEQAKPEHEKYDIVAIPSLGGRFDQTMASINLLYAERDRRVFLVSDESLTMLLDKGSHDLDWPTDFQQRTCGVMPIGEAATITTTGLQWNLSKMQCRFGGMVSTSNIIAKERVTIETDAPVVWTVEVPDPSPDSR